MAEEGELGCGEDSPLYQREVEVPKGRGCIRDLAGVGFGHGSQIPSNPPFAKGGTHHV